MKTGNRPINHFVVLEPVTETFRTTLEAVRAQTGQENLVVTYVTTAEEANQLVRQYVPCLVGFSIERPDQVAPSINFVRSLSDKLDAGEIKMLAINKVSNPALTRALEKLKLSVVVTEPVPQRTLLFKLLLQIRALDVIRRQTQIKAAQNERISIETQKTPADDAQNKEKILLGANAKQAEAGGEVFKIQRTEEKQAGQQKVLHDENSGGVVWQRKTTEELNGARAKAGGAASGREDRTFDSHAETPKEESLGGSSGAAKALAESSAAEQNRVLGRSASQEQELETLLKGLASTDGAEVSSATRVVPTAEAQAEAEAKAKGEAVTVAAQVRDGKPGTAGSSPAGVGKASEPREGTARVAPVRGGESKAKESPPAAREAREQPSPAAEDNTVHARGVSTTRKEPAASREEKTSVGSAPSKEGRDHAPSAVGSADPRAQAKKAGSPANSSTANEKARPGQNPEARPNKQNPREAPARGDGNSRERNREAGAQAERDAKAEGAPASRDTPEGRAKALKAQNAFREALERIKKTAPKKSGWAEALGEEKSKKRRGNDATTEGEGAEPDLTGDSSTLLGKAGGLDSSREAEALARRKKALGQLPESGEEEPTGDDTVPRGLAGEGKEASGKPLGDSPGEEAGKKRTRREDDGDPQAVRPERAGEFSFGSELPENTWSGLDDTAKKASDAGGVKNRIGDSEEARVKWEAKNDPNSLAASAPPKEADAAFRRLKSDISAEMGSWQPAGKEYFFLSQKVEGGIASLQKALPLWVLENGGAKPRSDGKFWVFARGNLRKVERPEELPAAVAKFLEKFLPAGARGKPASADSNSETSEAARNAKGKEKGDTKAGSGEAEGAAQKKSAVDDYVLDPVAHREGADAADENKSRLAEANEKKKEKRGAIDPLDALRSRLAVGADALAQESAAEDGAAESAAQSDAPNSIEEGPSSVGRGTAAATAAGPGADKPGNSRPSTAADAATASKRGKGGLEGALGLLDKWKKKAAQKEESSASPADAAAKEGPAKEPVEAPLSESWPQVASLDLAAKMAGKKGAKDSASAAEEEKSRERRRASLTDGLEAVKQRLNEAVPLPWAEDEPARAAPAEKQPFAKEVPESSPGKRNPVVGPEPAERKDKPALIVAEPVEKAAGKVPRERSAPESGSALPSPPLAMSPEAPAAQAERAKPALTLVPDLGSSPAVAAPAPELERDTESGPAQGSGGAVTIPSFAWTNTEPLPDLASFEAAVSRVLAPMTAVPAPPQETRRGLSRAEEIARRLQGDDPPVRIRSRGEDLARRLAMLDASRDSAKVARALHLAVNHIRSVLPRVRATVAVARPDGSLQSLAGGVPLGSLAPLLRDSRFWCTLSEVPREAQLSIVVQAADTATELSASELTALRRLFELSREVLAAA